MTRSLALLAALLIVAPLASVEARETVRGREATDDQVDFGRSVGRDTELLIGGVRKVQLTNFYEGNIVQGTGAEVRLMTREGEEAVTVERIKFRSAEDAAHFYETALDVDGDGKWALDRAGEWIVRVSGPGLSDPGLMESVLESAWKRGPKAGPREARVMSVLDGQGFVFEDNGQSPTLTKIFDSWMDDARARNESGSLASGETLNGDNYANSVGDQHVNLSTKDGIRRGWYSNSDMAVMMPSYAEKFLTMKPSGGFRRALGNLFGGGD